MLMEYYSDQRIRQLSMIWLSSYSNLVYLDTRTSVSGFILHILDAPVSWRAKDQRQVTLLSSETESKAMKEIMFMIKLLGSMNILVKLPLTLHIYNVNAIFMLCNVSTMSWTKCMDIK